MRKGRRAKKRFKSGLRFFRGKNTEDMDIAHCDWLIWLLMGSLNLIRGPLATEPRYNPGRIREAPRGEYWTHGLDAIKHYGQYIDTIQLIPA